MMSNTFTLTKNEKQIMDTFWREGRGLTRSEIIDLTPDKTWKPSSIHILINQLLDKGALLVEGETIKGINTARIYGPALSKENYDLMQLGLNFKKVKPSRQAITGFFAALVNSDEIDEETIEELEDILENRKEQ